MRLFLMIVITVMLLGCGHVVSKELRANVDKELTDALLFKNPDMYKGKTVMLGGIIASSKNTEEGTYIEVVQKPLDHRGRPQDTDTSYGRFLILYVGYLDIAIYSTGREIAVAGEVIGGKTGMIGDLQYHYPLIRGIEIHLLEPRRDIPVRFGVGIFHTF